MSKLDDLIAQETAEWEMLSGQKASLVKAKSRDVVTLCQTIIGGYFLDIYPKWQNLQPKETEAENDVEFAEPVDFMKSLVDGRVLLVDRNTGEVIEPFA